jgi:hypothetical protein
MPRARNPIEQIFKGSVAVGVRMLDANDAPVAFRIEADGWSQSIDHLPMVDWRSHGNNLYEAVHEWDQKAGVLNFVTPESLIAMGADRTDSTLNPFWNVGTNPMHREDPIFPHEAGYRQEVDDFQKIQSVIEEKAKQIASSLRVVDGRLYRRRFEPLFKVDNGREYTALKILVDETSIGNWERTYRIDEYNKFIERIKKRGRERELVARNVEIVDESVLTANPAKAAIIQETVRMLVNRADQISKCPVEMMIAFASLRDELHSNDEIPDNFFTKNPDRSIWNKNDTHKNESLEWANRLALDPRLGDLPDSLLEKIRSYGEIDIALNGTESLCINRINDLVKRYEAYREQNQNTATSTLRR